MRMKESETDREGETHQLEIRLGRESKNVRGCLCVRVSVCVIKREREGR